MKELKPEGSGSKILKPFKCKGCGTEKEEDFSPTRKSSCKKCFRIEAAKKYKEGKVKKEFIDRSVQSSKVSELSKDLHGSESFDSKEIIRLETKIDMLEAELKILREKIKRYEEIQKLRFENLGKIQTPPNPKSIRI